MALPSQAANQTARVESIKKKREQLSYNYEILPKLALAKGLPEFVELSDAYIMERLNKSIPLQTNAAMVKVCAHCTCEFKVPDLFFFLEHRKPHQVAL